MDMKRFTEEFKTETVKKVVEQGHSVADVANRLGQVIPQFRTAA